MRNLLKIISGQNLTDRRGNSGFYKTREILTPSIREIEVMVAIKNPAMGGTFASVESSFRGCLSTRINDSLAQIMDLSSYKNAPESRRRDLHSHLLVDKKDSPLHDLRRQATSRAISFKQIYEVYRSIKKDRMFYGQLGSDWLRMATAPSNLYKKYVITN